MPTYKPLFYLGSTIHGIENVELRCSSFDVDVYYEYQAEELEIRRARFKACIAFGYENIKNLTHFVEEAFDTIVEVSGSDWLQGHLENWPQHMSWPDKEKLRHFMMICSNWGALQFIAESFEVDEVARSGAPESLRR